MVTCEKTPVPLTTNSAIRGSVYADSAGKEIYGIKVTSSGPYGELSLITEKKDFIFEGLVTGPGVSNTARKVTAPCTSMAFSFSGEKL
jgi:hypothetical protein